MEGMALLTQEIPPCIDVDCRCSLNDISGPHDMESVLRSAKADLAGVQALNTIHQHKYTQSVHQALKCFKGIEVLPSIAVL